ncbi:MAG TPA: DJ-1/PfpI family protein [Pirellulales bacterium]|jgi:transcriptional regulator GlxA family with amidase domain|nr:DJ-1/PfpI family protein [Pirellulales bacterium]
MNNISRRRLNLALLVTTAILPLATSLAAPPEGNDTPPAQVAPNGQRDSRTLGIVLYPKFELLDVYGPAEIFGNLGRRMKVVMVAQKAGPIASAQGPQVVADFSFEDCPQLDLLLVPGGFGTFTELHNDAILDWLRARAPQAEMTMSVCSGSALLAKAGLLDGRRATSNKRYFQFAVDQGPKVQWVKQARWVDDGDRVTSSGVSAGIDMALHVVERLYDTKTAEQIADGTEYQWHRDPNDDPFAKATK